MGREDRKNGSKSRGASSPGWEIVYTGFILIMLCFFIMLCAFSTIEKSKVEHFVASFNKAVSILPKGVKARPGNETRRSLPDIAREQGEMALIFQELQKAKDDLGLAQEFSFSFVKDGIVVRLADKALFDPGVAKISKEALRVLDKMGAVISSCDYPIQINGHTDDVPIRTDRFLSNWELSTARAVSVLRYFLDFTGISAERLSAAGFGEFHPIVPNETPELRAKNRRVEIIFTVKTENRAADKGHAMEGSP
ncbi:MAG: OmpA/MotB family protein [Thermodesulfobacteriota bacterium]